MRTYSYYRPGLFPIIKTKNEVYPHPSTVRKYWIWPWSYVIEKQKKKKSKIRKFLKDVAKENALAECSIICHLKVRPLGSKGQQEVSLNWKTSLINDLNFLSGITNNDSVI